MAPKATWLCAAFVTLVAIGKLQAQPILADGFEESCLLDTDGDRLVDCQEAARGTSLTNPDTDGDGLKDGDEVLGTAAGLNLPAMGVNPRHKDMLVEMDWTDDAFECAQHTHRPLAQTIDEAKLFYASIPVANVDGLPGVNFIADYGQGGAFAGGNFIPITDGIAGDIGPEFFVWKAQHMAPNRAGFMRYQIHGHRQAYGEDSSGAGNIGGDHSVITLRCLNGSDNVRNTIIHELGHNFGLRHGGDSNCNEKFNYNSLMNYNHQFPGVDTSCDFGGEGIDNLGYSDGSRIPLVNGELSEAAGVCAPGHPFQHAIDWDLDGEIDQGFVTKAGVMATDCAQFNSSQDFNDYAALHIAPYLNQGGAPPPDDTPTSAACPSPPDPGQ